MILLPTGYQLRRGERRERTLLLQFLHHTYQELFPEQQDFGHLAKTIEQYFSVSSPLWWIEFKSQDSERAKAIAGLWLGNGIDQITGERYAHIFMLYVQPDHRGQGLALALLNNAQQWSKARGDRQLGLQVFP
ncbi:MAG: GNAT family N-acetyltransferase, partial [Microcystaceae cyanobacterium]